MANDERRTHRNASYKAGKPHHQTAVALFGATLPPAVPQVPTGTRSQTARTKPQFEKCGLGERKFLNTPGWPLNLQGGRDCKGIWKNIEFAANSISQGDKMETKIGHAKSQPSKPYEKPVLAKGPVLATVTAQTKNQSNINTDSIT